MTTNGIQGVEAAISYLVDKGVGDLLTWQEAITVHQNAAMLIIDRSSEDYLLGLVGNLPTYSSSIDGSTSHDKTGGNGLMTTVSKTISAYFA